MSDIDKYSVGWVCAIPTELAATKLFLDEEHPGLENKPPRGDNAYVLGRIGCHNVVIATLPKGRYGIDSATAVMKDMLRTFENIKICLMVGIGGGAPNEENDIRLGDVVVGVPDGKGSSGVFQYDFGKTIQEGSFQYTGFLNQPPNSLLTAVSLIIAKYSQHGHRITETIDGILSKDPELQKKFGRPNANTDRLYRSNFLHCSKGDLENDCAITCGVDASVVVERRPREIFKDKPAIRVHYGLIASANQLMKDALIRDKLSKEKGVLCFEMEAAGLMNHFPCLVIRGICDYADSHKNKEWQNYAAMTASAYAKDLLYLISADGVEGGRGLKSQIVLMEQKIDQIFDAIYDAKKSENEKREQEKNEICLKDLWKSDPTAEMRQMERRKGGLLPRSSDWIFHHEDFQHWESSEETKLLWIKGDPGKGKTMLLISIVNRLESITKGSDVPFTYFFCQGNDERLNNPTDVLRGLIHLLCVKSPHLITHLRKEYDNVGAKLFETESLFTTLSSVFRSMLRDEYLKRTYIVIDALDECVTDKEELMDLIIDSISAPSRVKWIVSSRDDEYFEWQLNLNTSDAYLKLSLEQEKNAKYLIDAVNDYIDIKVCELLPLRHDTGERDKARKIMQEKAQGTFLWVSLVIQELRKAKAWQVQRKLEEMPRGLESLYARMMDTIQQLDEENREHCRSLLSLVTVAYRPLRLAEIGAVSGLPQEITERQKYIEDAVAMCGSFLTIQGDYVSVIHQSVQDFLNTHASGILLPSSPFDAHRNVYVLSQKALSKVLRRNIYGLQHFGLSIEEVEAPVPDPLTAVRYACTHWVNHFCDAHSGDSNIQPPVNTFDGETYQFLSDFSLYWLEAIGLTKSTPEAIVSTRKLETLLEKKFSENELLPIVRDLLRFMLRNSWAISNAPLQLYTSALSFSPNNSIIRKAFPLEQPEWINPKPAVESDWGCCLKTIDSHKGAINSIVFSHDGRHMASGSQDCQIKVWDTGSWDEIKTLDDHGSQVTSVAFSHDDCRIASGSLDGTIKLWDWKKGTVFRTFESHVGRVRSLAFSHDDSYISSGSETFTIKIWDIESGEEKVGVSQNCYVSSLVFSHDARSVAVTSPSDGSICVWDLQETSTEMTPSFIHGELDGRYNFSAAFSPDDRYVAFGSDGLFPTGIGSGNYSIEIWDVGKRTVVSRSSSSIDLVNVVTFSCDGRHVAAGSKEGVVKIWDAETGLETKTFQGERNCVNSIAFSPRGRYMVSGSEGGDIRIWDVAPDAKSNPHSASGSADLVTLIKFSHTGHHLASVSNGDKIKIWEVKSGKVVNTLYGHGVRSVAFTRDDRQLVLVQINRFELYDCVHASRTEKNNDDFWHELSLGYTTVKMQDVETGKSIEWFDNHTNSVNSIAVSHNGCFIANGSNSKIKVWDATKISVVRTLSDDRSMIYSLAFSHDNCYIAFGSKDGTVKIWDWEKDTVIRAFDGNTGWIFSVSFSHDDSHLAVVANETIMTIIRVLDVKTGSTLKSFELFMDRTGSNIEFDATNNFLEMNGRRFEIGLAPHISAANPSPTQGGSMGQAVQKYGYAISEDGSWITWNGKNLLWIPHECRSNASALWPSRLPATFSEKTYIALSSSEGQILVIGLPSSGPPSLSGESGKRRLICAEGRSSHKRTRS